MSASDSLPAAPATNAAIPEAMIVAEHVTARYGGKVAISDVNLRVATHKVTAIIGPSGCGKSTLLRCLNRMHEVVRDARVEGRVLLGGEDIYARDVDASEIRQRIGMLFQRPNPFPTLSIKGNVAVGAKLIGHRGSELDDLVEWALRKAGLWEEVREKLNTPAIALSGGQQQRLCIARCIAVRPEVLLMDEPCSALDPIATLVIEDLMRELAREYTIVIVTHNMQQAARVSDFTAFMLAGEDRRGQLIEFAESDAIFTRPTDERTEAYVTGRFG